MKNIIVIIFGVLITLVSCNIVENKIIIEGQITRDIPRVIEYSIPINKLCHTGISGSTEPDSNGRFAITMNLDESAIISFQCPDKVGYLIVEPNHKYKINIDLAEKNKKFRVAGNSKTAQNIFNSFYNRNGRIIHFQKLVRDILSYSPHKTATQIADSLLLQKTEEIAKFDELYKEGSISKEFNDIVKNDRNCFYSSLLATIGYWKTVFRKKNINRESLFFRMSEKYYSDIQRNYCDYLSSPVFYRAIWHYCQFLELSDTSFNASIYKEIYEKKIIHTHHIEVAEKYLSKGLSDIYNILYFTKACKNNKFEEELISVYNNLQGNRV